MQTLYATDLSVRLALRALNKMDACVEIQNDVFDVADRLKEIDGDYYPVYNLTRRRFEIHHRGRANTLQLVIPYDCLDARAIQRVKETRREWVENMLRDMDRQNAKAERSVSSQNVGTQGGLWK